MISLFAPLGNAIRRLLLRCWEKGCWRYGEPCWDVDMDTFETRAFWRKCRYHVEQSMREEAEKERHNPKFLIPGDRVRVLVCAKPEECAKHGNHEGALASTTYSKEFSERACANPLEPLQPSKPGDLIHHIDSDEGVHYHAIEIVKIAGGTDEQRAKYHKHCHHQEH